MSQVFDLFGDPVHPNHGRRGRPAHVATQANRDKVAMLLAFGWSNERIASALVISLPTLRRAYKSELKVRLLARDRLDARLAEKLFEQVNAGNVGAMREFRKLLAENDQMEAQRSFMRKEPAAKEEKAEKLGKKEAAQLAAESAGLGTEWGSDLTRVIARPN